MPEYTVPPRASVLLPFRDAGATLDEAIASIRGQTMADWELLAVDDGSTDRSADIVERHAREDPRVRRVPVREGARGIVAALETARAEACAPILVRMDGDDRSHPERLALQMAHLSAHPETALVGTHVRYFPQEAVRDGARRYEAWLNSLRTPEELDRDLWVECPLAHPTFAMRTDAVAAVGGYRDGEWPEDYELLLRLRTAGYGLGVIPQVLLEWREGPDRLSRIDPRYAPAAFRALKVRFLAGSLLRDRDGLVIWGAGPVGKAFAREALAQGIAVRAFVDLDLRKIGQEVHGALVISRDRAADYPGSLHVAAVAQPGARHEIRRELSRLGWSEGSDFVAVA